MNTFDHMPLLLKELYNLVHDLMPEEDFQDKISKRVSEYNELLTNEAVGYLIVDELGRLKPSLITIAELQPFLESELDDLSQEQGEDTRRSTSVALAAEVIGVDPIRTFQRNNGSDGEVANLIVTDGTGQCRVTLWNSDHIDLIRTNEIHVGSRLRLANAQVKSGPFGLELSLGRWGILINESAESKHPGDPDSIAASSTGMTTLYEFTDLSALPGIEGQYVNVTGTIVSKSPLRRFTRRDGKEGSVINLELFDGTSHARITLWDEMAEDAERAAIGDTLELLGAITKRRDDVVEIHNRYSSRLKIRK